MLRKIRKIIKLNKIKRFFKKLAQTLAEKFFLASIFFILLALALGALVFYKYSFLVEKKKLDIFEKPFSFPEKTFQEVLKTLKERQKKFEEIELKEYPDLFKPREI